MRTIQALQDHTTATGEQATYEDDKATLANQIHMQVEPQQVPVSVNKGSGWRESSKTVERFLLLPIMKKA